MTEVDAWKTLITYAREGRVQIDAKMTVNVLRRTLAKVYQPRKVDDDDRSMRQINACIDVLEESRDRRELRGETEGVATAKPTGSVPWQPDPNDASIIHKKDYSDLNFIKKSVFERSQRMGNTELLKAWSWDGRRFRRVIAVYGNDFALEELGRALLFRQSLDPSESKVRAIFLTRGDGRARRFQLIMLRSGRSCEDVSRYQSVFEGNPDDPLMAASLSTWLDDVSQRLVADRSRRR